MYLTFSILSYSQFTIANTVSVYEHVKKLIILYTMLEFAGECWCRALEFSSALGLRLKEQTGVK